MQSLPFIQLRALAGPAMRLPTIATQLLHFLATDPFFTISVGHWVTGDVEKILRPRTNRIISHELNGRSLNGVRLLPCLF